LPGTLTLHEEFISHHLGARRPVVVYTPPGYRRDTRRHYPLLLLHDGQNVFDPSTAYVPGQHWRARETADYLLAHRRIEPLIIAAVYHGAEKRLFEYTPTRTRRLGGGGAALHARMVIEELLPWLREHYRISPKASNTGVGGSSLGGLVSLWMGLEHPDVFGRLAVFSPSVWWDRRVILQYAAKLHHSRRPRLWLDMGTYEGETPGAHLRDARLLKAMLVGKGWREGRSLAYHEADGAHHSEAAWAARLPLALEFLYPRKAAT
jgi:predicted alpha/beta superfamily hydrolase